MKNKKNQLQIETELKNKIISYFKNCVESKILPQKAGLLIELGLSREEWSETCKLYPVLATRADHFIEKVWVEKLLESNATGAMFYLKNTFKDLYNEKSEITLRMPKPILEGVEPISYKELTTKK